MIVSLGAPALAETASNRCEAQPGDTVYSICQKNHITVEQFAKLNPGLDINRLKAGASVKIRAAGRARRSNRGPRLASGKMHSKVSGKGFSKTTESAPVCPRSRSDHNRSSVAQTPRSLVKSLNNAKVQPAVSGKAAKGPSAAKSPYLAYSDPAATDKNEPSVAVSLVRVALALVFVAALAYLSLLALKGFMSRKVPSKSSRQRLHVLETTGLGTNRALHVVQIDGKRLLVGSTSDQISLISELDPPSESNAQAEQPIDFASVFSRASAATKIGDILRDGASFLQKKTVAAKTLRQEAASDDK